MQLFIFSAVSHQTLSCGVDKPKWFACVLMRLGPSRFRQSRWIKLCKSARERSSPPPPCPPSAALWLTFHESNPHNLQHNGCHCTIALALFHAEQSRGGETPCVRWVLVSLLAQWAPMTAAHLQIGLSFKNSLIVLTFYGHTVHIFTICCEMLWVIIIFFFHNFFIFSQIRIKCTIQGSWVLNQLKNQQKNTRELPFAKTNSTLLILGSIGSAKWNLFLVSVAAFQWQRCHYDLLVIPLNGVKHIHLNSLKILRTFLREF